MFALILAWNLIVGFSQVESNTNLFNQSVAVAHFREKEVCMKILGCFSITDDFKSLLHRPINVLPQDRSLINTQFLLYTRRNAKESHQLDASYKETFSESNFNPKDPIIFIVHGFMDSELFGPWMQAMKDEFLMYGDYNVIIIDWSGGNKPPYYQATSNTRVVGAEIAVFIQALEKYTGVRREDCHIIGHSLGSHIAGYAGARLKTLGRITGEKGQYIHYQRIHLTHILRSSHSELAVLCLLKSCDPAEPYFQNMPSTIRLDPTDANFVDVIHSDATDIMFIGFGMSHKVGHVDFYPNNGRKQPGCKTDKFKSFITEGLNEGSRRFASCNHQRSLDFMHHTINYRKVVPVAFECTSWNDFLEGKCAECGSDTKRCAIMGIRADEYIPHRNSSVQHAMYLQTSGKSPFWLYHYQVSIKLYKPKTSHKDVKGTIDVTLFGSRNDVLAHVLKKSTDLYHGARYQFLVTTEKELGEVKSVSLKWFSSSRNPLDFIRKPNLYVQYITVIPMNTIEKSPRNMTNRVFCGKPNKGINPKTTTNFERSNSCLKLL